MFPLEIFPERSLAESVITTVWVGVFVVCFFNLRFGWPFSGLVVPGYVVPLMIAKPAAAAVVCIEGFLTYLVVRCAGDRFRASGFWSSFFGRDRFFALIVASLVVRLLLDGWALPVVGEYINHTLQIDFDYRNNLSSFGLIIVALIGNQFWKSGLVKGQIPFWTTIGLSYLLTRFLLMGLTNFNIGNLEYMYENISASLVASPKAYILLLTCAYIASRMNLQYGWDFNGILIPSLLALEWYQPLTIFSTFLEAFVILGLADLTLRLSFFQQKTIEGARKLLLFFNISFLYKLALGHVQQWFDTSVMLTDFYGYGYLVPTLIAVKMHDKHIPLMLTRATVQTSLGGAVVASLVGFGLTFLPQAGARSIIPGVEARDMADLEEVGSLHEALRSDKLTLYEKRGDDTFAVPLPHETDIFMRSLRSIQRYVATRDPASLRLARIELDSIGYEMQLVDKRYLYLRETGTIRGWGIYAFDLGRKDGMVVEVPAPVDEWATLEAGALLFDLFGGRALAIAGCSRRMNRDGSSDVLKSGRTLYSVFHRMIGRSDVLQVRGYADQTIWEISGGAGPTLPPDETVRSALWVRKRIPRGFDLQALRERIGPYRVEWGETPHINLQRRETRGGFGELVLSRDDRRRLLYLSVVDERHPSDGDSIVRRRGLLADWLLERAAEICPRGSNAYRTARQEELLFLDEEVISPLLQSIEAVESRGEASSRFLEDLEVIQASAAVFDYRVVLFHDTWSDEEFVVLVEDEEARTRRWWGTYVLRLRGGQPFSILVPRPGFERYTLEYGVALFERLEADALLLAGAHPRANDDGSSDLVQSDNRTNLLSLMNQVILRERLSEPFLAVQSRAFGYREDRDTPRADALLALASGCTSRECLSPLALRLHDRIEEDSIALRFVTGDEATSGYEAYGTPQAHYAMLSPQKEFAILWLSPFFRLSYRQESLESYQTAQFDEAGIPTRIADLHAYLQSMDAGGRREPCSEFAAAFVERYVATGDIVTLGDLDMKRVFAEVERVIDRKTRRAFLLATTEEGVYPVVFNLAPYRKGGALFLPRSRLARQAIEDFIHSRVSRLEILEDS